MRKKNDIPLSSFLTERTPIRHNTTDVSHKNITIIDQISPLVCSELYVLNLSHNKIITLINIKQFSFLKQLNISNNKINNCNELEHLKDLYELKKLHINNNPFLSEPIQKHLMDVIMDIQTDITIHPFQNDNNQSPNKEIKVVFLKNYLRKIDITQQSLQQSAEEKTQQSNAQLIVNKVLPQFYTIIQDAEEALDIMKDLQTNKKYISHFQSTIKANSNSRYSPINSPTLKMSKFFSNIQSAQDLSPQTIQTIYYRTLCKVNPMFTLLHSPATSLNNEEKNILLQALKTDHKEKFIELTKERNNNQNLMRDLDILQQEKNQIIQNNSHVFHQNVRLRQEYEWIDGRYKYLQSQFHKSQTKLNETLNDLKRKNAGFNVIDNNYKKIKQICAQKSEELKRFQLSQQNQQVISSQRQTRIKKNALEELIKKGEIWNQVLKQQKLKKDKRIKELKIWGIYSFKVNRQINRQIAKIQTKSNLSFQRTAFNQWRQGIHYNRNQKTTNSFIQGKFKKQFIHLLKERQAKGKIRKLKDIWSKRFFKQHQQKHKFQIWKLFYRKRKSNQQLAIETWSKKIDKKYFLIFKDFLLNRFSLIDKIQTSHTQKTKHKELMRFIYLLNKEKQQIERKYNQLRTKNNHDIRANYYTCFKSSTKKNLLIKSRKQSLNKMLLTRKLLLVKDKYFKSVKKQSKLCSYLEKLNKVLRKKILQRQKKLLLTIFKLKKMRISRFNSNMFFFLQRRLTLSQSNTQIQRLQTQKLIQSKIFFMKSLHILRLRGKNFVKHRTIQEMQKQMDINDLNAMQLLKQGQLTIQRCQNQIIFLKRKIQQQSLRQMIFLEEKDQMLLSINESYEIMTQLRKEVDLIRHNFKQQQDKYNKLIKKYNEVVASLRKKGGEQGEWLHDTLKDHLQ